MIDDVAKNAATDEAVKATYDELSEKQKRETEYHIYEIIVATDDEAKAAQKRLRDGEDFDKVLAGSSKEGGPKGGDIGWVSKEFLAAKFGEAILNLEPGRFSDPVKTQSDWIIVRLEAKRQKTLPPLEQIRAQIQRYVEQKAQTDFIAKLRESAKIDRESN
jgi:peptidyl-prolyl cis-trans isomerase C